MKNVILFVNETRLKEQASNIKFTCHYLQEIHDGLVALGATPDQIMIDDLKSLMVSDGSIQEIKSIVLRGKVLQVAGMMIAKESIHFDDKALRKLSTVCHNAPSALQHGDYYEIVSGKVKPVDNLESQLQSRYTVYGSQRQKEIADKLKALATRIEEIRNEIGATTPYHPMRNPESWFEVNSRGEYVPNIHKIADHVAL